MVVGDLYNWIWFHTEFLLTPIDRRPFTFIMRDYIFKHPKQGICFILIWYAGMLALLHWHPFVAGGFLIGSSLVLGHVVWGAKWVEGQQEYPTYLDNGG